MANKQKLTPQELHEFFSYCASLVNYNKETGDFTWRRREEFDRFIKAWNNKFAEKSVGNITRKGYIQVVIGRKGRNPIGILLHRLAWFIVHGEVPPSMLDHKNQVKNDNRITNLQLSSHLDNAKNICMMKSNTSGITGVHWSKQANKWLVQCVVKGRTFNLGYYVDIEEAGRVAKEFRTKNGFTDLHGKHKRDENGGNQNIKEQNDKAN